MANISENLQKILTSRYGKDVRQAIHDSISDINDIAEGQEELINEHIQDAEAWAKGTKEGTAVPSTDPAYHNNSKYYSEFSNTNRLTSEAFAKGTHDGTAVESGTEGYHDNAKYYKEQAETAEDNAEHWYQETLAISQTLANAIIARGTVAFADLPSVSSTAVKDGFMYNISDNFTTTSDFVEGAGINIPMGANVYKVTINNVPKWDILAGSSAAVFVGTEAQIAQADAQGLISENTMIISLDGEAPYELTSSMILHGNDSVENVLDDIDDEITEINTALNGFYVVERTYYVNAQSDGVKTFSGMLDELKTKLNTWCDTNLNDDDFITIDYLSMPGTTTLGVRYDAELNKSNISIRDIPLFGASVESGHVFYAWYVMLKTSGSTAYNGDVTTSNTVVANNASTSVVPAGRKYALAFKKYRKISIS